jgi:hypothetical protein
MSPRWMIATAALLGACGGEEGSISDIAQPPLPCPAGAQDLLSLKHHSAQTLNRSTAPVHILVLSTDSLVTLDGRMAEILVYGGATRDPRRIPTPEPFRLLTQSGSAVFASGSRTIYRLDPAGKTRVEAVLPPSSGTIVGLAADSQMLWVATTDSTGATYLFAKELRSATLWRQRSFDGPAHIEALGDGRVAAALFEFPHSLVIFDSRLAVVARITPPLEARSTLPLFSQSLIRLDCGRMLHLLAELTSHRRIAHLYSTEAEPEFIRTREILSPIGFAHAMHPHRRLVGMRALPGRWEVITLDWSWTPN